MAGQNRSTYARSNSSANRGLGAFFRGAFILLVALTLSFGLGFFVIARMVPSGVSDGGGPNGGGSSPNGGSAGSLHTDQRSQHSDTAKPTLQVTAKPVQPGPPAQDGPVLLPDNDVQKPDKLGTNGANSPSNGSDGADTADSKTHTGNRSDNEAAGSTGASPATGAGEPSEPSGVRRSRRSRTSGAEIKTETGAVQPAGSPDSTAAPTIDSSRTTTTNASAAAKAGIYRVQIGVYSTREKAEEVARSAADKGIATTLHVINRDGRTLYRIQQSTHRDRTKAELDRQKLIDAGFDATIINPS